NVVDTAISKPNATIAPGMFKLDIEPISPMLKNNKDAHEVYIEKTIENTNTVHGFVECARTQNPSEPLLESAYMFTKHIQELLVYVSQTCPNLPKPSETLVVITPMNKDKRVRFAKPVTSSSNIPNNALVKHSVRNAKFESICAICNKCLFDANHDMCIIDYVNDVNVHSKSKSKRNNMRKVWKPTDAVATACYTQNRSLILKCHNKTPYELLHDRKPDLSYLHVFGALCYPTNDGEDLGKLKPKADIGIFVSYALAKDSCIALTAFTDANHASC
ncbi:retrovirus-related pol polyprotein from transposon TNT 1-94, partial [Tanacetum coccineum]